MSPPLNDFFQAEGPGILTSMAAVTLPLLMGPIGTVISKKLTD